jgi:hypothetical protein
MAGLRRGTAALKNHEGRDNLHNGETREVISTENTVVGVRI